MSLQENTPQKDVTRTQVENTMVEFITAAEEH